MPNLPFKIAEAAPGSPRVGASAFKGGDGALGQVGQAISQAGQVLQETRDRVFHAEQDAAWRNSLSKASIALAEEQAAIEEAGDHKQAEALFEKAIERQRANGAQLRGPYAEEFSRKFEEMAVNERLRIRAWSLGKARDNARAETAEGTVNWMSKYADTGEYQFLVQAQEGIDASVDSGATDATQGQTLKQEILAQAVKDRAAKLRQANPAAALRFLKTDPLVDQVSESLRSQEIEKAEAELAERERVALLQLSHQSALDEKLRAIKDDENLNRVLEGTLSPEEVFALDWGTARGREHGMEKIRQMQSEQAGLEKPETIIGYYGYLTTLSPQQLVAEPIDVTKLDEEDAKFWLKEKREAREKPGPRPTGAFTIRDDAKAAWKVITTDTWAWDADLGTDEEWQFRHLVDEEYRRFVLTEGREPNGPDRQGIVYRASEKFTKEKGGVMLPDPLAVSLDAQTRAQIVEALRLRGNPNPSEDEILAIYRGAP